MIISRSKIESLLPFALLVGACTDSELFSSTDEIIGGTPAYGFPEAVTVNYVQGGQNWLCSGTLITPMAVLTAAHCVNGGATGFYITAPYAGGQTAAGSSAAMYDYPADGYAGLSNVDLAVIFLASPINLSQYPSLTTTYLPPRMSVVDVGRVINGTVTDQLYVGPVHPTNRYGGYAYYESPLVAQPGDSGGSLIVHGTSPHILAGVTSGVTPSAEYSAAVAAAASWIQSITGASAAPFTGCVVEQSGCPVNPSLTGRFYDTSPSAQAGQAACFARPAQYAGYCGNDVRTTTSVAWFAADGSSTSSAYTPDGCRITLPECALYPTAAGVLADSYDGSSVDQARCLRRAAEYSVWCENRPHVNALAEFFQGGGRAAYKYSRNSSCWIYQDECKNYPSLATSFEDRYDGSQSTEARCHARAAEYAGWCGNPASVTTTAEFRPTDGPTTWRDFTPAGCGITQSGCTNHPAYVGRFADAHDGSNTNPARCQTRARDWALFCGNNALSPTDATFGPGDGSSQRWTYNPDGCVIEQYACYAYPGTAGRFVDDYDGSATNGERCLQRAAEYANWCNNSTSEATWADFYQGGAAVGSRVAYGPRAE